MLIDLRKRFGSLVAANRRQLGLTQHQLAEAADLSDDMIAQIETGTTGASFPSIISISEALKVDPAELFSAHVPEAARKNPKLMNISAKLARLSPADLDWIDGVLTAVLSRKG